MIKIIMVMSKEEKKEYDKIYYQKNKEKRKLQNSKNYHEKYKYDETFVKKRIENSKRLYHNCEEYKHKCKIRARTKAIYGSAGKGNHYHHIDYKTPHNFIVVDEKTHLSVIHGDNEK